MSDVSSIRMLVHSRCRLDLCLGGRRRSLDAAERWPISCSTLGLPILSGARFGRSSRKSVATDHYGCKPAIIGPCGTTVGISIFGTLPFVQSSNVGPCVGADHYWYDWDVVTSSGDSVLAKCKTCKCLLNMFRSH